MDEVRIGSTIIYLLEQGKDIVPIKAVVESKGLHRVVIRDEVWGLRRIVRPVRLTTKLPDGLSFRGPQT